MVEAVAGCIGDIIRNTLLTFSTRAFWIGLIPAALLLALFLRVRRRSTQSITVSLPFQLGSWTYDMTPTERIVAWRMHVQLVTRKAALPFDPEHDLIVDVYDSLFALFTETRALLLDLPPREFERESGVATLILKVQNDGVRPHLTAWQADFRRWWQRTECLEENKERSPQEIQRDYPRYGELVTDLQKTNMELRKYADELLRLAKAQPPSLPERLVDRTRRIFKRRNVEALPPEQPRIATAVAPLQAGDSDVERT